MDQGRCGWAECCSTAWEPLPFPPLPLPPPFPLPPVRWSFSAIACATPTAAGRCPGGDGGTEPAAGTAPDSGALEESVGLGRGAGSTDGAKMAAEVRQISAPPGTKYTWEQLPAAIKALAGGDDIDYDGASGPIDMDRAGDASAGVYDLYRFQDGKIKLFGEAQVPAPAEPNG